MGDMANLRNEVYLYTQIQVRGGVDNGMRRCYKALQGKLEVWREHHHVYAVKDHSDYGAKDASMTDIEELWGPVERKW